jgi:hypothetical protein
MGKISLLKTAALESSLQESDIEEGSPPVSLLAFLQAENLRLRTRIAELQLHTTTLREALESN